MVVFDVIKLKNVVSYEVRSSASDKKEDKKEEKKTTKEGGKKK